ncbi:hypothetical protein ACIRJR_07905 [Streptomyces sp. NPDC102402]|uniref:hypothetical protein n=1 Tax=Streptomyces sp. NPDC102402 TaxID=3366169 RepID=UPI00380FA4B9
MSAACPDLPLVVLPANNSVRAALRPAEPVETALRTAVTALETLHRGLLNPRGARTEALSEALETATLATARLAELSQVEPMDATALVPIVPNHAYFGVRTTGLDDARLVSETTVVIARTLADLRIARLSLNQQAAEVLAMIQVLRGLAPQDAERDPASPATPAGPAPVVPGQDELTRWVITHHFYFVLNLAAAESVTRALALHREGEADGTRDALREATTYVRAFTAAMMHSGDMSAPCYDAEVRPTMSPPAVPAALTGRTQPEHKAFRKAMRTLARTWTDSFDKVAADSPDVALARDALLEADLQDIEQHVTITAALVGDESSIIQADAAAGSAIAMLRTMRHTRAEQYRPLMRFGDNVTLITD